MTETNIPMPEVVSHDEWRAKRVGLLEEEKAHTREKDRINAARRRLPMVKVDKEYGLQRAGERHRARERVHGHRVA